ncbi:MAG: hypothetical protein J6T52_09470 [Bacteroidaceae bacterium]|nr:hypothetical protein [Bacteroidaceae bacterium]
MKRFIFFALVLMGSIGATTVSAQSTVIATLSHEGSITTFYGTSALGQALDAAVDGDIITLSPGTFRAADIRKSITLRGAGYVLNTETHTEPTVIIGDFTIYRTNGLTIEGINHDASMHYTPSGNGFNTSNAKFIKCKFTTVNAYGNWKSYLKDAQFINCKFTNSFYLKEGSNASLINCVVNKPEIEYSFGGKDNSYFNFQNCVITGLLNTWDTWHIWNSSFYNCIIYVDNYTENSLSSTNSGYNNLCISTDGNEKFFSEILTSTNNSYETDFTKVFKDYTGTYSDDLSFELTDEAKQKYKGTDGTEIGIYGGDMPFDPTPSNPQITKLNVASKSTANGKLSVDITVKGLE